ncbi:MBL fold metallo-hydrolase [Cardiobacteriaceae bacterium TAE3-ERU3]|nr:MBL fold metallo-hydrolase [Cardiobacteriaceae bacterium TAE3-ERU3]
MSHEVIQLKVEDRDNFIHVIADRQSSEAAVIDPAWDAEGIADVLDEEDLTLTMILITHSHHDHVNAIHELYKLYPEATIFISEKEHPVWPDCPEDAILVNDGDEIAFASSSIGVISTPGHTIGGCCYHIGNDLFTGDTLFIYGCGRADLKGGNPSTLYRSLQKLKKLSADTRIWVGHDYSVCEESTLGEQFAHNPFLMINDEADFIRYRMELAGETRSQPYGPIEQEELDRVLGK